MILPRSGGAQWVWSSRRHTWREDACVARELDTLDGAEQMLQRTTAKQTFKPGIVTARCTLFSTFHTLETKEKQKIDNIYSLQILLTEKQNLCRLFFYLRFLPVRRYTKI